MGDPLEDVLRLVSEGRLTVDEAAPILDALSAREAAGVAGRGHEAPEAAEPRAARWARIMVMEGGRRVVDLRVPASLGRFALGRVPGLSAEQVGELQEAISSGVVGPLLEVEDPDGDGVKILLE